MKILVLDTETTGLDITRHEIIQLGYISLFVDVNNKINLLEEKEFLITPLHLETASPEALKINGFSKERWRGSLPFSKCMAQIRNAIESSDILLGQNLIFDLRFINQSFRNLSLTPPRFPNYIDTKKMGSRLVESKVLKSASMDKMCEHFNIQTDGRAHTALVDCHRTLKVWQKLLDLNIDYEIYSFKEPYDPHGTKKIK